MNLFFIVLKLSSGFWGIFCGRRQRALFHYLLAEL